MTFLLILSCFSYGEINVSTTIGPLGHFIEKVGREKVDVTVMIPLGAEPHTYEPRPSQMRRVSESDLYVLIGTDIEFEKTWLPDFLSINPEMKLCDTSQGVSLIGLEEGCKRKGHCHGGDDPHIWLSPKNAVIMVENIRDALKELDPENADFFQKNAEDYKNELLDLDYRIREKLKDLKNRAFLVFHPAWGYYAQEYGLKEITIEFEGKTPGPRTLSNVIKKAREHDLQVVFISPQFSTKSAKTIARSIDAEIRKTDPLTKEYIANLERMTAFLVEASK